MRTDEDEVWALYVKNLWEPDLESVTALVGTKEHLQKFGDPDHPHLPDREFALNVDCMGQAIRVAREDGLLLVYTEAVR